MGIIDDYLSGVKDDTPAPTVKSSSVINDYMAGVKEPSKKEGSAPTGYNAATGKTSYEKPSEVTTGSHTPSLSEVPIKAGKAVLSTAGTGITELGQGLSDTLSGKPASGIGRMGMGALTVLGSPTELVSSPVTELTGNENIGNRAGFVAGFGLPVAPAAKATIAARPTNRAFKDLVDMVGPENAGDVAKAMRSDPRLTPADLSPAVKSATQKLFTVEGDKTKNYIADFANNRASGANEAVNTALDASLGSRVNPVEKLNELKTNIVNAGKQAIEPALAKTKPVDLTPVVSHIDNVLKPGVNQIISNPENMLPYNRVQETLQKWRDFITNDKLVLTDPNELHKLQSGIRRQAEGLLKSGDPEAKATAYALYGLRNEFINAIGKAGPQTVDKAGNAISEYRAGLSKYRDENDVADAFRHGHDSIIKNSKALEDNPEFFKQWVDNATDLEKEAAKEGAGIAIRTAMNAYRAPVTNTTSKAQQMAQVEFNRNRIETLFGKEEANAIFKKLENERKIAETNNDLIHGSQTAMRLAADSRVALPVKGESKGIGQYVVPAMTAAAEIGGSMAGLPTGLGGGLGLVASAVGMGAKNAGKEASFALRTAMAKEKNAQLAKMALPTEGPSREALIQRLEEVAAEHSRKQVPRLSIMNRAKLAVSP